MARHSSKDQQQLAIFGPFFGTILLTIIVWIYMYIRRIHFIKSSKFSEDKIKRPEEFARLSPLAVSTPSDNLKNLFETPVLFYAISLYLFVTKQVDTTYIIAAWIFLLFRILHSFVHCTINIIMLRFYLYLSSSLALFFIIFRAMLAHFLS